MTNTPSHQVTQQLIREFMCMENHPFYPLSHTSYSSNEIEEYTCNKKVLSKHLLWMIIQGIKFINNVVDISMHLPYHLDKHFSLVLAFKKFALKKSNMNNQWSATYTKVHAYIFMCKALWQSFRKRWYLASLGFEINEVWGKKDIIIGLSKTPSSLETLGFGECVCAKYAITTWAHNQ